MSSNVPEVTDATPPSRQDVRALATHELGHALGLPHLAAARGIMSHDAAGVMPSAVELHALAAWYRMPIRISCANAASLSLGEPGRPPQ